MDKKSLLNFQITAKEIEKIADWAINGIIGKKEIPIYSRVVRMVYKELCRKYPIKKNSQVVKTSWRFINDTVWRLYKWH